MQSLVQLNARAAHGNNKQNIHHHNNYVHVAKHSTAVMCSL